MEPRFSRQLLKTALPITLQALLLSSFSVVDQLMVGQLGDAAITGIGLAGRFVGLYNVLISAVSAAAGILLAQYLGRGDTRSAGRCFWQNGGVLLLLALGFTALSAGLPRQILGLYSEDVKAVADGGAYLGLVSLSFLPMAATSLLSVLLRCREQAKLPLYASTVGAVLNTVLNDLLIFGHLGFPALGARGAALASVLSQMVSCGLILLLCLGQRRREQWTIPFCLGMGRRGWRQYLQILAPILVCEFFWSLGENVYAAVYGRMGTDACAAMMLLNPVQALMTGALTGLSQSAAILVGRELGQGNYGNARAVAKRLLLLSLGTSAVLSVCLLAARSWYTGLFRVDTGTAALTRSLLIAYALVAPVKVANMVLGGGILRSGGKTSYVMTIDLIGTWCVGVPVALLAAFVWNLPVYLVYFLLSQEEVVRLAISLGVFRKNSWMRQLENA